MSMYDCQASAAVPLMLIPCPMASLVLKRRSSIVHALQLVYSSMDGDVELQEVSVTVTGAGATLGLLGTLVFLALTGHFMDPSKYPIAPL